MKSPLVRPACAPASDKRSDAPAPHHSPRYGFRSHILIALAAAVWAPGYAAADGPVVRVEEDWEVVIGVPEPDEDAPQIVTVISPYNSLDSVHAVFELNHSTLPSYGGGGMQLQKWFGDYPLSYHNSPSPSALAAANETVRFTMKMSVGEGKLQFEVVNGQSSTWGQFGGQGYLKTSTPTLLNDLSTYNTLVSTQNSRVGFASHRVKKLARTEVRYYSADELVSTDADEVVVHAYNPE